MRKNNVTKIKLYTKIYAPIEIVFDHASSIETHQLSTRETNEKAISGRTSGHCELNDEVTWRAKHFGIYQTLTSKITKFDKPNYFQDCMVKGAFSFFEHDHHFEQKNGLTLMTDVFCYGVPYGFVGKIFDVVVLEKYMINLLEVRNQVIKKLSEEKVNLGG